MDTPTAISALQSRRCPEAWAFLYDEYRPDVRKFAGWLLRDDNDAAEDMTQELFLRLPHRIRTYDPSKGDFRGWLVTMAVNFARNWSKQHALPEVLMTPQQLDELPDPEQTARDHFHQAQVVLYDGMAGLSSEDRGALKLFIDGYSSREVAAQNQESPRAARQRLHKATKHLKHEVLQ
jgi:RNA polymerase sigma factor (sigma-70 family)